MATYAVLDPQNNIQYLPIRTWGDTLYVLLGKAHRDLVNGIDQAIANVARPAFDLKKGQLVERAAPLAEILKERFILLQQDQEAVQFFFNGAMHGVNRYHYQWDAWSQLIDLRFLVRVLAYAVHTLALKVWDLIDGISQKMDVIRDFSDEIDSYLEYEVGTIIRPNRSDLLTHVSPLEYFGAMHGLKIDFQDGEGLDLILEVARCFEDDHRRYLEGEVPQELVKDPSKLKWPILVVTFDGNDEDALRFQCMAAGELLIREESESLVIRTESEMDFASFGFKEIDEEGKGPYGYDAGVELQLWRLNKDQILGENPPKMDMDDGSQKTWTEIIEAAPIFNALEFPKPFFPEELLFAPEPEEII